MGKTHLVRNLALLTGIVLVARQYKLYQGLTFSLNNVSISKGNLLFRIALDNPTGVSATLNSITGSIYADDTYIAHVTYDTVQVIAPYNRTLITLEVDPDLQGVLSSVFNFFFLAGKKVLFQFRGNAVVNSIPVPVVMDYRFG